MVACVIIVSYGRRRRFFFVRLCACVLVFDSVSRIRVRRLQLRILLAIDRACVLGAREFAADKLHNSTDSSCRTDCGHQHNHTHTQKTIHQALRLPFERNRHHIYSTLFKSTHPVNTCIIWEIHIYIKRRFRSALFRYIR